MDDNALPFSSLVCIVCPRGCSLKIEKKDGEVFVSGNFCKRGRDFALTELTEPKRTICSTVKTVFPDVPVLPVRVSTEIPKNRIFDVMKQINAFTLDRKVNAGDVLIENVLGLGADIIATSSVLNR